MGMEQRMINEKKYFVWDNPAEELIDDLALNMMEQNRMETILPFRLMHFQEDFYFRYDAADEETLESWLEKVHSKAEVFQLIDSIILAAEETENYLLEVNHLCMETAYVTVNQNKCRFTYIPLKNYQGTTVLDFVTEILNRVHYAKDETYTYIFDLMNAITRGDVRNVLELKKWMRTFQMGGGVSMAPNELDDSVSLDEGTVMADVPEQPHMSKSLHMPEAPRIVEPPRPAQAPMEQKLAKDIIPPFPTPKKKEVDIPPMNEKHAHKEKKGGLFSFGVKAKGKKTRQADSTMPSMDVEIPKKNADIGSDRQELQSINQMSDDDATVLIDDFQRNVLVRRSTGEEFPIEEGSYIIGSGGKKHVDILITGNPAISHTHAQIVKMDGAVYIEDLNSTNGTFVNGEELKGTGCALLDGMRITLANEEFIYEMRRN